ncbi:acetylglutamate kinase [Sulfurospirillum arcachonense]|uniref:acetylglutamate kinase n=1 Tax=Sulfurospirillum arcachonense TaxID=57666 RepID=UPI0004684DF4|nr:acetylglutamate kinase [Sulfurospirillum arcachonense]
MKTKLAQVKTLLDALPYIKSFRKKTIVIKYGGSAQINPVLKDKFAQDIILLHLIGLKPVIVHGGGNKISSLLDKLDIKSEFVDGLRVTDEQVMEVVEMVLSGSINKEITTLLNHHGAKAIGITGKDANFIKAEPLDNGKYGLVGNITKVDKKVIKNLIKEGFIPVVAPIASGNDSTHAGYNINADFCASKIAAALKAEKIIFLTDTKGILDKEGKLITKLNKEEVQRLKDNQTITGGMLPKVDACLEALNSGVKSAQIIDGRVEHSILLELFTSEGICTLIENEIKEK